MSGPNRIVDSVRDDALHKNPCPSSASLSAAALSWGKPAQGGVKHVEFGKEITKLPQVLSKIQEPRHQNCSLSLDFTNNKHITDKWLSGLNKRYNVVKLNLSHCLYGGDKLIKEGVLESLAGDSSNIYKY